MNQKGFTLVELIISIILISAIIIPAFSIALSYKNKMLISSDKQQLLAYKNRLTVLIQSDILTNGLKSVDWVAETAVDGTEVKSGKDNCNENGKCVIKLDFKKAGSSPRYLIVRPELKRISYVSSIDFTSDSLFAGTSPSFDEVLPVAYADILTYGEVNDSFARTYIDKASSGGAAANSYATIFIPIKYVDDTNDDETLDYGIHIVAELNP